MSVFYISRILSRDLMSRPLADDFYNYIKNSNDTEIIIDFSDVHFATRSFMDEFYVRFKDSIQNGKACLVNLPVDADETIVKTKDIQDLENHFEVLAV